MSDVSSVEPRVQNRALPSRRALVKGAAWAAPVAAMSVGAPAIAASPCLGQTYDSHARGRLLGGRLLGFDLDTVVALNGVHAQAIVPAHPDSTDGSTSDLQTDPLNAEVLDAIELELGGAAELISFLLALLTDTNVGTLNQYAFAHEEIGDTEVAELGASGAVSDSGVVNFDTGPAGPPALGSLDLQAVLQQLTGMDGVTELLAAVANLELEVGAVAGHSMLDKICDGSESPGTDGELPDVVTRQHLVAGLSLLVESPVLGETVTALETLVGDLEISVSAITDLLTAVLGPLGGLASALVSLITGLTGIDVAVSLELGDIVDALPSNPDAPIRTVLGDGTLTVDIAGLLGAAYEGETSQWLNSLAPNSRLFIDYPVPGDAVSSFLHELTSELIARVKDAVYIRISAGSVSGILATGLLIEGTLTQFLDGEGTVELRAAGLNLLGELGSAVVSGLLEDIGSIVDGAIDGLLDENGLVPGLMDGVNGLLQGLFTNLQDVIKITVNAQNDSQGAPPDYYDGLEAGRYDVAALHIEALDPGDVLDLSIARGSAGANTLR